MAVDLEKIAGLLLDAADREAHLLEKNAQLEAIVVDLRKNATTTAEDPFDIKEDTPPLEKTASSGNREYGVEEIGHSVQVSEYAGKSASEVLLNSLTQ